MQIAVRYMAQLRRAPPVRPVETIELDKPCSAADVVKSLAKRHDRPFGDLVLEADGGVRPAVLLFVGDEQVGNDAGAASRRRRDNGSHSDGRRLIDASSVPCPSLGPIIL